MSLHTTDSDSHEYSSRSSQITETDDSDLLKQQCMKRSETEPVQSSLCQPSHQMMKRSETEPVSTASANECEISNSSTLDASI